MEMFESSTNGALWTGSKGPSETNVHHAPPPPIRPQTGSSGRTSAATCLLPQPQSWVLQALPTGCMSHLGGGGRTGPGLAWRLPAATHVWCFWKSDLNAPTPALTPAPSSPGKGADVCKRIEGYRRARTPHY